ncbi:hypothetical protein BDZ97DRAFT_1923327 [Flammula alnicola]|nr:hypothetical protein BDZ97DRAFT_1923327 [Flammula alnicola]
MDYIKVVTELLVHEVICGDLTVGELASGIIATLTSWMTDVAMALRTISFLEDCLTDAEMALRIIRILNEDLFEWDFLLATDFRAEISELSLAAFFDFWNKMFGEGAPSGVDGTAITAIVGGLTSMHSRSHLSHIILLFQKGTASNSFAKEPGFLLKCIAILQERCGQVFSFVAKEEIVLTQLIYDVLFRKPQTLMDKNTLVPPRRSYAKLYSTKNFKDKKSARRGVTIES